MLFRSVVLVSGVHFCDSVVHMCINIYILFQILFPYRLLQNIEYSSLCYIVGSCWLSILYIVVCICEYGDFHCRPNFWLSLFGILQVDDF